MSDKGAGGAGVLVVTDSASDLPEAMASQWGIEIVPLSVRFGDEELVDRRDLTPRQFWDRMARSTSLPETAAPSPGAFEEIFRRAAGEGRSAVVCVTISAALSATASAAQLAAGAVKDVIDVEVVDSRCVSMAEGFLALAGAERAAAGDEGRAVADHVRSLVPRARTFATLDTLENLKKGGRIGAAQALLGSILSIKPVIEVRDGKVEPESRQRTRGRSLAYLADKVRAAGTVERLAVMHGDAPDVEVLVSQLGEIHPREEIVVAEVGATIGTHAGPRVIGVAFVTAGAQ